ncbi:chymotrypsin-1-like [Onthophagus taurus]|uniref:chymotrypsin-1-like n=1 Tax=Onthophagus taurus TaxID=166361 RepID=UPI0039BE18C0
MYRLLLFFSFNFVDSIPQERIIGGEKAETITKFPYQVMVQCEIEEKYLTICGGALIGKNKILTAAHCVLKCSDPKRLRVIAGVYNPDIKHAHQVKCSIPHPDYDENKASNDIAVLCLMNTLQESDRIKTIKIAQKLVKPNTKAIVSGWGQTKTSIVSKELKYAIVNVIDSEECEDENPFYDETQICAESTDGSGPCKGDSGGPLVANKELIGIVSYGIADCITNAPRMYTNVYYYRSFIEKHKC